MKIFAGFDFGFVLGVGVVGVGGVIFVSSSFDAAVTEMGATSSGGIQNSAVITLQLEKDSNDDMEDEGEWVKMRPSRRRAFKRRGAPLPILGNSTPMGSRTTNDWAVEGVLYAEVSIGHTKLALLSLDFMTWSGAEVGGEGRGRIEGKRYETVEGTWG